MNGLFVSSSFILCKISNKYISRQVRQVTLKAVLSQQAYLLFYTKLTPTQDLKVRLKASNFWLKETAYWWLGSKPDENHNVITISVDTAITE